MSAAAAPVSTEEVRRSHAAASSSSPSSDALLLRVAAEVLRAPHKVFSTALIFLHRFKQRSAGLEADACQVGTRALRDSPYRLVCACLFVAAKVNEVTLSASDLINVVRCLLRPTTWAEAASAIPALRRHSDDVDAVSSGVDAAGALAGEAYYAAKSVLLHDEQALLRVLRFQVAVELPHPVLLNLCRTLNCPREVARTAVCLLNDLLTQTDIAARASAALMAGAALHLAGVLRGVPPSQKMSRWQTVSWWIGLDLRLEQLEEVGHELLDAVDAHSCGGPPAEP